VLVQGTAAIHDVIRTLDIELPEHAGVHAIGGLASALAGVVPSAGSQIPSDARVSLEVIDASPRRVRRVRGIKREPAPPELRPGADCEDVILAQCRPSGRRSSSRLMLVPRLGVGVVLLLVGCHPVSDAGTQPLDPPRPKDGLLHLPAPSLKFIKTEEIGSATAAALLRAPAKVTFRENALSRVSAPLAGRIVEVHVKTGEAVHAGAPLVTLDCPEAASARASLTSAEAAVREARLSLEREERMLRQGVGVERERLAAEKRLVEADAELRRTRAARAFVGPGTASRVVLRSPIAGTVISRGATVGAAVQAGGEPLVEVGDPDKLWIVADVFERDLPLIREGQRARIEIATLPRPLEGTVAAVGAAVTGNVRTAPVRIVVESLPASLRAGTQGRAAIETGGGGLTLPAHAVLIHDGAYIVYVSRVGDAFERRRVQVAPSADGFVRVLSGVEPGDRVVVEGALLLDGAAEQLL
jgi:cobalt-zinc-cadmium efflux system membrane fusion protein